MANLIFLLIEFIRLVEKLIPFDIGLVAEHFGLGSAMWLLLAGTIALLIGLLNKLTNLASNVE